MAGFRKEAGHFVFGLSLTGVHAPWTVPACRLSQERVSAALSHRTLNIVARPADSRGRSNLTAYAPGRACCRAKQPIPDWVRPIGLQGDTDVPYGKTDGGRVRTGRLCCGGPAGGGWPGGRGCRSSGSCGKTAQHCTRDRPRRPAGAGAAWILFRPGRWQLERTVRAGTARISAGPGAGADRAVRPADPERAWAPLTVNRPVSAGAPWTICRLPLPARRRSRSG